MRRGTGMILAVFGFAIPVFAADTEAPPAVPDARPVSSKERYPGPPLPDVDTKVYNLDACLRIADQISPEVMMQRLKIAESEALVAQAKAAAFLPEFGGRFLVGPAPGQDVIDVPDATASGCTDNNAATSCPTVRVEKSKPLEKLGPFVRFELNFVQPIYTWGKLSAARTLAESGVRNSRLEMAEKRIEVRKRIREIYWGILAAEDGIDLIADVENQLAENRDKIRQKIDAGDDDVTLTDLYRVEIFLGQLRMQLEKIYSQRDLARTTMAIFLGLDPEEEFRLSEEDLAAVDIQLDPVTFYEDSASINHFNAKRVGIGVEARSAQLDTLKLWYKPDLFVAGQGFAAYAPRRQVESLFSDDYFRSLGGGIVLGLNFEFNAWMQNAKRDEVLAQYEQARIGQEAAVMGLRIQARQAFYEMVRAQKTVDALVDANISSRKWFRSSTLNYSIGVETTDNLLIAYQNYLQTRGAYINALFENNKAWAELVQAAGLEDLD